MKIPSALAVAVALVGLSASAPVYAAPTNLNVPVHMAFAKTKVVKFSVRNDSGTPVELKVGDQLMPLESGKTLALKLPIGTRVLLNTSIPKHQAGEVLAEVSSELNDSTIAIK
jgi:hypothetical protein